MATTINRNMLTPQALQRARAATVQKRAASAAGQGDANRAIAQALKRYRNAEPWTYYDALILRAAAGDNFANFESPSPFFAGRTTQNTSLAVTNVTDTNKLDADMLATSIAVDVHCDTDVDATAGAVATSVAFTEAVVNFGVLAISFGQDVKYVTPISDLPAGGGIAQQVKIRSVAVAADHDSAYATNGTPDTRARRILDEPILFRRGVSFSISCQFTPNAVDKINGLAPLTGDFAALIRVKLIGVRGKPMLEGVPVGRLPPQMRR